MVATEYGHSHAHRKPENIDERRNFVPGKGAPGDQPGFLGAGHIARALIQGNFADTDPFILLMDDMLDKKDDHPSGGPHPHAGFETVTLLLEGELGDETHLRRFSRAKIKLAK